MQIPNLLNMAMTVVGKQPFNYIKFLSRETNSIGVDVANYAAPLATYGQVQPVPRDLYQQYGLDFQKNYLTVYVSKEILDIQRDVSGDKIQFAGKNFQCLSETDWFPMDGWTSVLCAQI